MRLHAHRITAQGYAYFDKAILRGYDFRSEAKRWREKFMGRGGGKAMDLKGTLCNRRWGGCFVVVAKLILTVIAIGVGAVAEGCAWECMCMETTNLLCFRYYSKRSQHLGRQVVRLVFNKSDKRLRWANCKACVGGELRPWCSHIRQGPEYLDDIQRGRAISGACTDGRRPWGPNTLVVDSRYHRTTAEIAILSGQSHMSLWTGMKQDCIKSKMHQFFPLYEQLNNASDHPDPDDLIVMQNYGPHSKCTWKRHRENDDMKQYRKRFHREAKKGRDILNKYCSYE